MSLLPIADCLVLEHRICQCGTDYLCPAPIMHRLFASPAGEPRKLFLVPRKDGEHAMDIKTTHTVIIDILHCPICWQEEHNMHWSIASTLVPKRPLADTIDLLFDKRALNDEIRNALIKAGIAVAPRAGVAKTDYEKALEL